MSIFDDFQRMWMQKFPKSSLSDQWEQDVRASLMRHRQKITDLTKELEQETLYCEYLERLLSDVEKCKQPSAGGGGGGSGVKCGGVTTTGDLIKNESGSVHVGGGSVGDAGMCDKNYSGFSGDNMRKLSGSEINLTTTALLSGGGGSLSSSSSIANQKTSDTQKSTENLDKPTNADEDDEKNEESLIQFRRNGALNQCINELSTNLSLRRCISEVPDKSDIEKENLTKLTSGSRSRSSSLSESPQPKSPSHFITVIEVKEDSASKTNKNNSNNNLSNNHNNNNISNNNIKTNSSSFSSINKVSELKKNIENNEKSIHSNCDDIPKASDLIATIQQEAKKRIPPRPPPKNIRRSPHVEPPTVPLIITRHNKSDTDKTPDSSLERNVKPSDILRQKSNESLESSNRNTGKFILENMPVKTKPSSELVEEFERRLIKSESLEKDKLKNTSSPTGSLNKILSSDTSSNRSYRHATGSLDKAPFKGSDSIKTTDSRESLISDGAMSDKIKSYESVSSLGIDGYKHDDNYETEPYYDTVPLEHGGGGNNEVTLPMPAKPRTHKSSGSQLDSESPGRHSNYVNIDYFLSSQGNENRRSSIESDGEDAPPPLLLRHISNEEYPSTPGQFRKTANQTDNRSTIRHIISSIIASENIYVECLNKMVKYMKAINATLTTSQPVITEEDYKTIFFKIEELYKVHMDFLNQLIIQSSSENDLCVGNAFKQLAEHIHLYKAYLHNYGRAIDTVKKCGANNAQFKEIVSNIVLNSQNEQSLSLEDLLHKPVARVQKNALVLQDLLNETAETHSDYQSLKEAQRIIRQFLSEFNFIQTKSSMFPSDDKTLRRLVKNSFIVELSDGHRKLRHLFLFNDVIACAKYKAGGGRNNSVFEFELKWFIPVKDILIEDSQVEIKESSPVNILLLKSQACTVRDQILLEEKDDKKFKMNGGSSRTGDKHRKKLADLEAQLVLASPNLVFKLKNNASGKIMTFFLSSDFERSQWIDSIESLKESCNLPGQNSITIMELQAWIVACQHLIQTEMGSYLLRNSRDESLLVGDLHLTIQDVDSFDHAVDTFICIEVDSYGHYFRKAKTKLVCRNATPMWNESFVIELEGSQNLRILLYETTIQTQILRAKHVLQLSRKWLSETTNKKTIHLTDKLALNIILKFVPGEVTLRRVPTSKPGALFGAKMQQVLKREKRETPFIICACIREVERRGMSEVGIYRVSGSASDLAKLKKSFESNSYEAEQLLKEVDIHSVTGILKSYLRELPEALFTDALYPSFFETFNRGSNSSSEQMRIEQLQTVFNRLPESNRLTINLILDHLVRINQQELENKMSLHNLAMVFGPTLLRPGPQAAKQKDILESSTVDVMAQAGILYCFLQSRLNKL